jgi:predicted Zn-dependent protease
MRPSDSSLHVAKTEAVFKLGNLEGAFELCEKARAKVPDPFVLCLTRADIVAKASYYQRALI